MRQVLPLVGWAGTVGLQLMIHWQDQDELCFAHGKRGFCSSLRYVDLLTPGSSPARHARNVL